MKKILLALVAIVGCYVGASAQSILDVNNAGGVMNVVIDFSKASICGMTEAEFAEYEEDFYKDLPEIKDKLISDFNRSRAVDFVIALVPESAYTLMVNILSVTTKGDIVSSSQIVDSEGNVVVSVPNLYAKGGHIGTKLNLMGDGMYRTGRLLAREFAQMVKIERNRK